MTKMEMFATLKDIVANVSGLDEAVQTELVAGLDKEITSLENRAVKSKERAAAKRAETDTLKGVVLNALTDEFQTPDEIVAAIGDEEVTRGKVISRLTALVKDGAAEKGEVKPEGSKAKSAYRKVSA